MDTPDNSTQDSSRTNETDSIQIEQSPNAQSKDEGSTPLASLIEAMRSVHHLEKTADKAFQQTWFLKLIGLPTIALALELDSGWTVGALPFIAIIVSALVAEILKSLVGAASAGWFRLAMALSLTHVVLGVGFYFLFAKSTVIALFYGALIIAFLVAFSIQVRRDKAAAETLGLSISLRRELDELTDALLHPDVDKRLQRAASERADLRQVVANSLEDDSAIDHLGIQQEYDAGFADILDRAHALSTLKTQADQGSDAAQSQAVIAGQIFEDVATNIHELVVAVLGYAGTQDSSALVDLKSRTDDLRQARQAHQELES
ncbi:MAG: hypothetical protein CMH52_06495 [Myxococcales bacterium]|nr:hypothetical protein [Myxococcales bacterium]|tara:strand:- start:28 stop:981 length:954 start_codon:yes stop_codon:yes gene_type:complete